MSISVVRTAAMAAATMAATAALVGVGAGTAEARVNSWVYYSPAPYTVVFGLYHNASFETQWCQLRIFNSIPAETAQVQSRFDGISVTKPFPAVPADIPVTMYCANNPNMAGAYFVPGPLTVKSL
ncbi:hypothetical protein [Rhodococcus sp. NPDC058481]|uniref:hypothetical protein n=1 Tax=unclassified Rhodococcus (in: high G+C Gram-positive bacteria) TaxID=192944 RepID=UPI00364D7D7F